jgi:transcriptional regulator with XRE-family HTH domain
LEKKMAKSREVCDRISALRKKRGETQAQFATAIGVTQQSISDWESETGDAVPSCESYVQLANLAPYEDALWFLAQIGMNRDVMLSMAGKLLKESGQLPDADRIKVPRLVGPRKTDPAAKPIFIDADSVPVPGAVGYWTVESTAYDPIHHQAAGCPKDRRPTYDEGGGYPPIHVPGTIVILDTSSNDAADLQGFWDRVVLLQTTREGHKIGAAGEAAYPGLRIGKLCCATVPPPVAGSREYVPWYACLRPLDSAPLASPFILSLRDLHTNIFGRWTISKTADKQRLKDKHQPENFDPSLVCERAKEELRLYKGNVILGRVIRWYRPSERDGK